MPPETMPATGTVVGIVGGGRIGRAFARRASNAGIRTIIAARRGPESLTASGLRKGRSRRVLDLFLHQLAAHGTVFAELGANARRSPPAPYRGNFSAQVREVEKLDLEQSIADRLRLPDQVVQPRLGKSAVALAVDVNTVGIAWRHPIEENAKQPHRSSTRCRPHHQVNIARVEAVSDALVRLLSAIAWLPTVQLPERAQ
jgi:hypothetical protein